MLSIISAVTLAAEERSEMNFDALPEAVRNTVSHFIDQRNISKIEKVTDDGYIKFEIISTKTSDNKEFIDTDMTVAADGEVMQLVKEAPAFAIPFPVMQQINQRFPSLKVDEVEIVQTRHFLLKGKTNGQPINLKIYDDGAIQEMPTAQPPAKQPEISKPMQEKADEPPADSYQKVMPDEVNELPIDRSDYNFNPDSEE
ncbi:MAG: hypothetical protein ACU85E_00840 [Gammaproteobacteria bacterium]